MSWFFDLPLKQKLLFVLVVAAVVVIPIFVPIIIRNIRNGREIERQNPGTSAEAPLQKVTLSGKDGVTLSQETFYNMGQEDGNAYFLAPAGSDAKISITLDTGRGIGLLRVAAKDEQVACMIDGRMISFKVPNADCTVEAAGVDAQEGGGIYGAAPEYSIEVFGVTEDLLGLFAGKYNKASLISALGIAMESVSGNKAVKSLTFTGQEVTTESRNGRICLLALVNADEARRVLVYFDTASGAFSFATSVEADRELVLRNINKEIMATPSATPKPTEAAEDKADNTESTIEAPTPIDESEQIEKPTPTDKPEQIEKPTQTDEPERTDTPAPTATPMLKTTPTQTLTPTPKASPTPKTTPTLKTSPTPKVTSTPKTSSTPKASTTPKAEQAPKKVKKTDAKGIKVTAETSAAAFANKMSKDVARSLKVPVKAGKEGEAPEGSMTSEIKKERTGE